MSLAITYDRTGDPAEVLRVTDIGDPGPPADGQVQVKVTAFPIHPGDLLAISTPRTVDGDQVAGVEATGVVIRTGGQVDRFAPGSRVAFFPYAGAWAEVVNVDAALVVPVPDEVPDHVAAQMLCNPITVLMLPCAAEQHFSVGFDGVVLNNVAASSVGRLFTASAEHHQIATISVVRSDQRVEQLRDRFPSVPVVSTSNHDWVNQVHTAAAGRPLPVVLDPVGGVGVTDLLRVLSPGGSLIIYGELAGEPMSLHAATLLHSGRAIRAMTINRWFSAVAPEQRASDAASAITIATHLTQYFDVAAVYPLDRIADAARHASQPGKIGTVVVTP
jgi:NADPH:quinone reductase-like Zn-dependent oxidoreductase